MLNIITVQERKYLCFNIKDCLVPKRDLSLIIVFELLSTRQYVCVYLSVCFCKITKKVDDL